MIILHTCGHSYWHVDKNMPEDEIAFRASNRCPECNRKRREEQREAAQKRGPIPDGPRCRICGYLCSQEICKECSNRHWLRSKWGWIIKRISKILGEPVKISHTGSVYWEVDNIEIRLSDHEAPNGGFFGYDEFGGPIRWSADISIDPTTVEEQSLDWITKKVGELTGEQENEQRTN